MRLLLACAVLSGVVPSIPFAAAAIQAQRNEAQDTLLAAERPAPVSQVKVLWTKGPRHVAPADGSEVRTLSESEALLLMQRIRAD